MKTDSLKCYVPEFLGTSKVFQQVYNSQGTELDSAYDAANDVLNQCFVDTATWGLKFWEEFLGISEDENKPYDQRRSVVKSKIRGVGTVTVDLMKNVAESYQNGEVQVTEDPAHYSFSIKFIGTRGLPPNIADVQAAIEEIKPAHLAVNYLFTYLTWDEFDSYNKTFAQWDAKNLTWSQFEIYKE